MVNPFLQKLIGAIVRHALVALGAVLVANAMASQAQVTDWIEASVPVLAGVGWSLYEKYAARQKLVVAQALPAGASEKQVEQVIKQGEAPPVTLPKDAKPHMPGTRGPGTEDLTGVTYPGTRHDRGQ